MTGYGPTPIRLVTINPLEVATRCPALHVLQVTRWSERRDWRDKG
jgi:hypothetical protein